MNHYFKIDKLETIENKSFNIFAVLHLKYLDFLFNLFKVLIFIDFY